MNPNAHNTPSEAASNLPHISDEEMKLLEEKGFPSVQKLGELLALEKEGKLGKKQKDSLNGLLKNAREFLLKFQPASKATIENSSGKSRAGIVAKVIAATALVLGGGAATILVNQKPNVTRIDTEALEAKRKLVFETFLKEISDEKLAIVERNEVPGTKSMIIHIGQIHEAQNQTYTEDGLKSQIAIYKILRKLDEVASRLDCKIDVLVEGLYEGQTPLSQRTKEEIITLKSMQKEFSDNVRLGHALENPRAIGINIKGVAGAADLFYGDSVSIHGCEPEGRQKEEEKIVGNYQEVRQIFSVPGNTIDKTNKKFILPNGREITLQKIEVVVKAYIEAYKMQIAIPNEKDRERIRIGLKSTKYCAFIQGLAHKASNQAIAKELGADYTNIIPVGTVIPADAKQLAEADIQDAVNFLEYIRNLLR